MIFFLIGKTLHSAGESAEDIFVGCANSEFEIKTAWKNGHNTSDLSYETSVGNIFELTTIKKISFEDYTILSKFFPFYQF